MNTDEMSEVTENKTGRQEMNFKIKQETPNTARERQLNQNRDASKFTASLIID